MDFRSFISEKKPKNLSVVCEAPLGTIYSWAHENRIPRKHWDKLIDKYRISWKRLIEMEQAANSDPAA